MAVTEKLPQLLMLKESLAALAPVELPEGYVLRAFREGDQAAWNAMMDAAFDRKPGTTNFDKDMQADPEFRAERVLIVERNGAAAATASAWFRAAYGPRCGYVHWVGTHPAHRGKKLGFLVSLAALHRMKAEGRAAAVLHTDDFRLPALRIYLEMGFRPALDHESQRERWRAVLGKLEWPERFAARLAGPFEKFPLEA
ncbi:MAG: GNAT family N-acetyltransferase [Planctomycetes bacterium]|nr:GNAT family N-acetyltransferase [Planctomycetota bacterium]